MLGLGLEINRDNRKKIGIVKNGLVLYLDGKDFKNSPPTSLWMDRSGLGNNATPSGMAYTTLSGSDGVGGVVFDGVDDYSSIPSSSSIATFVNEVTLNIKVKFNSSPTGMLTGKLYSLNLRTNPTLNCLLSVDGSIVNTSSTFTPITKTVYDFVFIYQNKQGHLYINGVEIAYSAQPIAVNGVINNTVDPFMLGKRSDSGVTNCTIYSTKIYNRALTNAEILQNYNASK